MADEKEKPSGGETGDVLGILLGIIILFVIVQRIYISLRAWFIGAGGPGAADGVVDSLEPIGFWFKIFALLISTACVAGIFHIRAKLIDLGRAEKKYYFPEGASDVTDIEKHVDSRWDRVVSHADSDNPNDWKIAILEADIILGDLLDHLGYQGDSIGAKLKQIEKSDFLTLDAAWEAHKVRNAIAHEGGQFLINQREVLRVLELYKEVFDEFYYV